MEDVTARNTDQMANLPMEQGRGSSWYAWPAIGAAVVPLAVMLVRKAMGAREGASREKMLLKRSRIDMQEAMDTALCLIPGQPVEILLEEMDGSPVWQVDVVPETGGPVREVLIDARNGRLLQVAAEFEAEAA